MSETTGRPVTIGAMIKREVPPARLVDHARLAARHVDELWVVEDLPFAGGITQAATVLAETSVAVGHGVAPAPFRNPAALAMEWATLADLHPGRFRAGLGHGVQTWMHEIGAGVERPLTLLRETLTAVRSLLHGETVTVDGRYVRLDGVALEFPPAAPPPISLGVLGPRSLALSGELADGTVLPEGHGPDEIAAARAHLAEGAARTGRTDRHHLTVFAACHVGPPSTMAPRNPEAPVGWEAVAEDPADVARRLGELVDATVDTIVLVPLGRDLDTQLDVLGTSVVPLLRAHPS